MSVKLSIITINRNNKDGLVKTIESVVHQTCTDYEYIIIDGDSTDGSREIIEQYAAHPVHGKKITYWVSEPDTGIYNAMNKGIRKATGEFCQFLNSGDWLVENETLEKVVPELKNTNVIYYGNICIENKIISYPIHIDVNFFLEKTISHQTAFVSRTALIDQHYYSEKYRICSDWLFFLKASYENNTHFIHLKDVISGIETGGISLNSEYSKLHDDEREKVINEVFTNLAPTILHFLKIKKSIFWKTISTYGNSKIYTTYLKIYFNIMKIFSTLINNEK